MGEEQILTEFEKILNRHIHGFRKKIEGHFSNSHQIISNNFDTFDNKFEKLISITDNLKSMFQNFMEMQGKTNSQYMQSYEYPNTYLPPRSLNLQVKKIK